MWVHACKCGCSGADVARMQMPLRKCRGGCAVEDVSTWVRMRVFGCASADAVADHGARMLIWVFLCICGCEGADAASRVHMQLRACSCGTGEWVQMARRMQTRCANVDAVADGVHAWRSLLQA